MFFRHATSLRNVYGVFARPLFRGEPARCHIEVTGDLRVEGNVWFAGGGRIRIGRGVRLIGRRAPVELRPHGCGEIILGDGVVIEDGASLEATRSILIGQGARIGPFCKIMDNHFHATVGDRFVRPDPVPVSIGQRAVVGPGAVILPGADLGADAWLGPHQVLSWRVQAGGEYPSATAERQS